MDGTCRCKMITIISNSSRPGKQEDMGCGTSSMRLKPRRPSIESRSSNGRASAYLPVGETLS